jgi:hypothetical protein
MIARVARARPIASMAVRGAMGITLAIVLILVVLPALLVAAGLPIPLAR